MHLTTAPDASLTPAHSSISAKYAENHIQNINVPNHKIPTPINVQRLERELLGYDCNTTQYLVNGFTYGLIFV
jgi:hypothetical protein